MAPLAGFVAEGSAPFGAMSNSVDAALKRATFSGMPVVKVGRGNAGGFVDATRDPLAIAGSNLTATKARLLLMACLLKFGCLPPALDPAKPTQCGNRGDQSEVETLSKKYSIPTETKLRGGFGMSGKHGHKPFEGHMHDYLAHVKAVEEDLEYYRAKRFEPRIFYLLRRNVVTFYDLLKVRSTPQEEGSFLQDRQAPGKEYRSAGASSRRVAR